MYHAVTHHATGHHGTSLLMTPQINIYEPLQYIFSAGLCLKQQGLTHSDKVYQVYLITHNSLSCFSIADVSDFIYVSLLRQTS